MKNLIKQTLERDFDLPQYTDFVKNLFNEIPIQPQEIKVPDSSKEFIRKITFLSDFTDVQKKIIDVYAVELSGGTKVARARSFQRNLISKLLKDNTKDAGLVAFYSKDNPDWRLSFIKLDYKLTDKGVKVEVGTPPKRYSFLVGKAEPSHTAQKQLLPILEDHKNNPLLSELEEAFSVEKVTKEFYERYRKLFEDLSRDLKKNKAFRIIAEKENIDIDNFAKKLLGQIVFLYFLQKKGWLGVPQDKTWGQGDKFFLRTLFDKAKAGKQDFYNHYLEHLFYDTLNNPRRDEVDPAYSRYFDCKIPFLNGGLFEPDYDWKKTIVYLDNEIFEEIIDTFDLYNFTVKEDEPLEKEVAVDPEMLGKVFENLLPENMRKGQGAYYTPREIVHYMCQESLINHLNTETKIDSEKIRKLIAFKDEELVNGNGSRKKALGFSDDEAQGLDRALVNIKVCDPACGSGAFLVGMLNEIVSARRILEPRSEYKLKKEAIQECIYGVDIDPGAVDIAKLRLWLSLVVDFELRDIEPLPNLDYKIMCGNSLLEELIVGEESIKLFDERLLNIKELKNSPLPDIRQEKLKKQLREKQKELLDLHAKNNLSLAKKKEIDSQILAINKELNPKAKKTKSEAYHPVFFADQADEYFKRLRELHKQFFTEYDPVKKKDRRKQIEDIELEFIKSSIKEKVDELDSKIKNLNMQDPGDRKKQVVLMKKKFEYSAIPEQIRNSKTRPYFLWKLNFFEVFQEKGGFDVVIANPPYGAEVLKREKDYFRSKYSLVKFKIDSYVLFIIKSFELFKIGGDSVFIVPNTLLNNYFLSDLREEIIENYTLLGLVNFKESVFEAAVHSLVIHIFNHRPISEFKTKLSFNINSKFFEVNQLSFLKNKFKEFEFINQSEANFLKKLEIKTVPFETIIDLRQAIKSGNDKKFIFSKKVNQQYKPILRGKDIRRWKINDPKLFLFYGQHLACPRDCRIFLQPHILIREAGSGIVATIDYNSFYIMSSLYCGIQKDKNYSLEFILALLNSSLFNFLMFKTNFENTAGAFTKAKIYHYNKLPVRICLESEQEKFSKVVKHILYISNLADLETNPSNQTKIKEYERQIDQMVYELYGLTKNEVEIIENANKNI